ncbi:MAG: hypothetical protein A2Y33_13585 [Spirochaetes bacterium GWF1_51_8]|nr:MAG: hypothetical protein A2Y33_13585 [Spirochaetes bacterium GWF1_51_8]
MKKIFLAFILSILAGTMVSCGGGSVKPGSLTDPGYYIQITERAKEPWETIKVYVYHDKMKVVYGGAPGKCIIVNGDKMVEVNEDKKTFTDVSAFLIDRENPAKGLQGYIESITKTKNAKLDLLRQLQMYYVVHETTIAGFKTKEYSAHDDTKTGEAKYMHLYFTDAQEMKDLIAGLEKNTSGLAKVLAFQHFFDRPDFGWFVASSEVYGIVKSWILDEFGEFALGDAFFSLDGYTETAGNQ